jgi:hypothetical protein
VFDTYEGGPCLELDDREEEEGGQRPAWELMSGPGKDFGFNFTCEGSH